MKQRIRERNTDATKSETNPGFFLTTKFSSTFYKPGLEEVFKLRSLRLDGPRFGVCITLFLVGGLIALTSFYYQDWWFVNNMWHTWKSIEYQNFCAISQFGVDGFGHQMDGLASLMEMHMQNRTKGTQIYYFDATFTDRNFNFDHLQEKESVEAKAYFLEVLRLFAFQNNQTIRKYKKMVLINSLGMLPEKCNPEVMYGVDNAWDLSTGEQRSRQRSFFVEDNRLLPPPRLPAKNRSIVFHVRETDALYRYNIRKFMKTFPKLLGILRRKYPNGKVIVHTDGDTKKYEAMNVEVFDSNTNVLQVFSDFVHSDTLILTESSLSIAASHLGPTEVIAVKARKFHVFMKRLPSWAVTLSEYLELEGENDD